MFHDVPTTGLLMEEQVKYGYISVIFIFIMRVTINRYWPYLVHVSFLDGLQREYRGNLLNCKTTVPGGTY